MFIFLHTRKIANQDPKIYKVIYICQYFYYFITSANSGGINIDLKAFYQKNRTKRGAHLENPHQYRRKTIWPFLLPAKGTGTNENLTFNGGILTIQDEWIKDFAILEADPAGPMTSITLAARASSSGQRPRIQRITQPLMLLSMS